MTMTERERRDELARWRLTHAREGIRADVIRLVPHQAGEAVVVRERPRPRPWYQGHEPRWLVVHELPLLADAPRPAAGERLELRWHEMDPGDLLARPIGGAPCALVVGAHFEARIVARPRDGRRRRLFYRSLGWTDEAAAHAAAWTDRPELDPDRYEIDERDILEYDPDAAWSGRRFGQPRATWAWRAGRGGARLTWPDDER